LGAERAGPRWPGRVAARVLRPIRKSLLRASSRSHDLYSQQLRM